MKEFVFWDEDDLSRLPKDFKLVPFEVRFLEHNKQYAINETPKTSTSKKSPVEHKPSKSVTLA